MNPVLCHTHGFLIIQRFIQDFEFGGGGGFPKFGVACFSTPPLEGSGGMPPPPPPPETFDALRLILRHSILK